jgi:hypothetical protein
LTLRSGGKLLLEWQLSEAILVCRFTGSIEFFEKMTNAGNKAAGGDASIKEVNEWYATVKI